MNKPKATEKIAKYIFDLLLDKDDPASLDIFDEDDSFFEVSDLDSNKIILKVFTYGLVKEVIIEVKDGVLL